MATFIELDSKFRDRTQFSNPAEFIVQAKQTSGWSSLLKDTVCVKNCNDRQLCNMLYCVELEYLILPNRIVDSNGTTVTNISLDPYNNPLHQTNNAIYISFGTEKYTDGNLIRTIGSVHKEAVFSAFPSSTFVGDLVGGQAVEWIRYETKMKQCIRINPQKPVINFRIFTNQLPQTDGPFSPIIGGPLNGFSSRENSVRIYNDDLITTALPDPTLQIRALFSITPLVRDGDYDNQLKTIWRDAN